MITVVFTEVPDNRSEGKRETDVSLGGFIETETATLSSTSVYLQSATCASVL